MMFQDQVSSGARVPYSETVIALHCSGASGDMWQVLCDRLDGQMRFMAPALHGAADGPVWPGDRAFSLDDEVEPIVRLIDGCERRVHLVGHSYGAAVALHVALARPDKVVGLTLYEPASFQLLRLADGVEFAEIAGLARDVEVKLACGDVRGSMTRFVNYWGGPNSWNAMTPDAQNALMRWAPKAPLDFRALLGQSALCSRYERLTMPCLILSGQRSPDPVREIANILSNMMPSCKLKVLADIGHMGPFTHAEHVAELVAGHVLSLKGEAGERSISSNYFRSGHAA